MVASNALLDNGFVISFSFIPTYSLRTNDDPFQKTSPAFILFGPLRDQSIHGPCYSSGSKSTSTSEFNRKLFDDINTCITMVSQSCSDNLSKSLLCLLPSEHTFFPIVLRTPNLPRTKIPFLPSIYSHNSRNLTVFHTRRLARTRSPIFSLSSPYHRHLFVLNSPD